MFEFSIIWRNLLGGLQNCVMHSEPSCQRHFRHRMSRREPAADALNCYDLRDLVAIGAMRGEPLQF